MQAVLSRREMLQASSAAGASVLLGCAPRRPTAVLTFDDAVASHRHFVAPFLADQGFGATFFVTHRWMDDRDNFMSWDQIAEIAEMGFEIGNHSWSHSDFSVPKHAARLEGELALVENELSKVGVEKPVSFAWCGNRFGPEALEKLRRLNYRFARRGLSPELDNRALAAGLAYDASVHDPLLIPSTGNSVPGWSLDLFRRILERASSGIVVLQFHGVPDLAHDWVHTPPALFRECMAELRRQRFDVLALRDLSDLVLEAGVADPTARLRNPPVPDDELKQPAELVQTRADLPRWTGIMARHGYSADEASRVAGLAADEVSRYEATLAEKSDPEPGTVELQPYPGGMHPRIGFLEGAIDPLRGSKASVFLPWDPASYVVVDLPELITSDMRHLFLAHTHVPTIWNARNMWLDNVDMQEVPGPGLELEWALPNGVAFGSSLRQDGNAVDLRLWLKNGLDSTISALRTQICVMLKGAPGFNSQTVANKAFSPPVAAVQSEDGGRWILTAWDRAGRCWGNDRCPCLHSDPVFPDCAEGETVHLRGRLWFYEGNSIREEIERARREFDPLPSATPTLGADLSPGKSRLASGGFSSGSRRAQRTAPARHDAARPVQGGPGKPAPITWEPAGPGTAGSA